MPDLPQSNLNSKRTIQLFWLLTGFAAILPGVLWLIADQWGEGLQTNNVLPEPERISLRTLFYWLAILTLPLTNLVRHILLRLNQTMPLPGSAWRRYLFTVLVSVLMVSSINAYGFWLFCSGDGFNTLAIFTAMVLLGLYLYRPKSAEYQAIEAALIAMHAKN